MVERPYRSEVRHKNLEAPDELRRFANGQGSVVKIGPLEIGQAVLQPGWRWSTDIKPLVGTESCQLHHLHVLLTGHFGVSTDAGDSFEFGPNDVIDLPPGHDAWVIGDEPVVLLDISGNVSDFALPASRSRVIATVLMTDIVDSTATAARLGDGLWNQRLAAHNRVVRQELHRYRGREINTTGDGFIALFESAGAALRCALAIRDAVRDEGLEIRAGVHTGEVDLVADDVHGIAVHATARIMGLAGASQVLSSAVTRMLADTSGLAFTDAGRHELKGLEQPLDVFAVEVSPDRS